MTISLIDAADLFDKLSSLCRGVTDARRIRELILACAEGGIVGLQRALGVTPDGIFGPITQAALDDADIDDLVSRLLNQEPGPPPQPSPPPETVPNAVEYAQYFASMSINDNRRPEIQRISQTIQNNATRYMDVANAVGMSYWPLVGIVHNLESGMNFSTHLYNGDPLTARTVHIPAGRPTSGSPPFTWEFSAVDTLRYVGWDKWEDWTIVGIAYMLERYNGFGYRTHGIPSPYLWAGSSIYTKGLYTSDGVFDPNAVSKQIGGMTMVRYFHEQNA